MTAPAQAPTDQPTPATPDELAAVYLRARDVPCPGCGYNRRDAATAACPECHTPLTLATSQPPSTALPGWVILSVTLTMLMFSIPWMLTSYKLFEWAAFYRTAASKLGLSKPSTLILQWHDYLDIVELIGSAASVLCAGLTLWSLLTDTHRANKWFTRSALWMMIGMMPFAWWNFYTIVLR